MGLEFQDDFWKCSFLADSENEFAKHEKHGQKNMKVLMKMYELLHQRVVDLIASPGSERRIVESLTNVQRQKRDIDLLESKIAKIEMASNNFHHEISSLRMDIDSKHTEVLSEAQHLHELKIEVDHAQEDLEKKRVEIKRHYDSILLTKDEYKKLLGCHIRLLSSDNEGDIYILTFGDGRTVKFDGNLMPSKSVKLLYKSDQKFWKLLETNPSLSSFGIILNKFEKSQDIHGLLPYLRTTLKSRKLK